MGVFDKLGGNLKDYVRPQWTPSGSDLWIALAGFILTPSVLGALIGWSCSYDIKTWYKALKKPRWTPPAPFFTIAWTLAYGFMGAAAWQIWKHGGFEAHKIHFGWFLATVIAQQAWPLIAFKGRKLDAALLSDLSQLGLLSASFWAFNLVNPQAALLLVPAWLLVFFDVFHTYALFSLNPQGRLSLGNKQEDSFHLKSC